MLTFSCASSGPGDEGSGRPPISAASCGAAAHTISVTDRNLDRFDDPARRPIGGWTRTATGRVDVAPQGIVEACMVVRTARGGTAWQSRAR